MDENEGNQGKVIDLDPSEYSRGPLSQIKRGLERGEWKWLLILGVIFGFPFYGPTLVPKVLDFFGAVRPPPEVAGQPSPEHLRSWALRNSDSKMMEEALKQMPAHEHPNGY